MYLNVILFLYIQSTVGMIFVKKKCLVFKRIHETSKRHLRRMGWGWCVRLFSRLRTFFWFQVSKNHIRHFKKSSYDHHGFFHHLRIILIGMILQKTLASECSDTSDSSKSWGWIFGKFVPPAQTPPRWNLSSCCERCYPRPLLSKGFWLWSQPWASMNLCLARKNHSSKALFKNPHVATTFQSN